MTLEKKGTGRDEGMKIDGEDECVPTILLFSGGICATHDRLWRSCNVDDLAHCCMREEGPRSESLLSFYLPINI